MPIISVRDNENNRWKKQTNKKTKQKKTKTKEQGKIEPTVKEWEVKDFVVHLS